MAPRIEICFDCHDPDALADFWCAALGYERHAISPGPYRSIEDPAGQQPTIVFQRVPEAKAVKNRVHLDLYVDDIDAERDRIRALGATDVVPELVTEAGEDWYVLADPEGNELCICRRG